MENEKLNQILNVVLNIQKNVEELNVRMGNVEKDVAELKIRMTNVENRLTNVETRLTNVENRLTNVENRLMNVEKDVTNIKQELKEVKMIALDTQDFFLITKDYIENEHKEALKERKVNAAFRKSQEFKLDVIRKELAEVVERSKSNEIKIDKLFSMQVAG